MPDPTKHSWNDVALEPLSPLLSRKLVHNDQLMLAQVFLKSGCIVPAHAHHNAQATYIMDGCLRFWLGDAADAPGDRYTDIHAG
ncbi:MAG: cupin domain-containing protein, partial [Gemmatimonadales bacterium]